MVQGPAAEFDQRVVAALPGTAPDTIPTDSAPLPPADSVAERLRRAEQAIEQLREQIAAQGATATQTASRVRLEFAGRVLVNAFANGGRVNNADNPQFARADSGGRAAGCAATRHEQQSRQPHPNSRHGRNIAAFMESGPATRSNFA